MRYHVIATDRALVTSDDGHTLLFEFVGAGADKVAEKIASKDGLLAATSAVAPLLERSPGVRLRWSRYITLLSPRLKTQDYTCGSL